MERNVQHSRPNRDLLVHAEQVRTIYSLLPSSNLGNTLGGVVLAAALWSQAPRLNIVLWLIVLFAFQGWRLYLFFAFRRAAPVTEEMPRWGARWAVGAGISGLIWGAAGVVLFVPQSLEHQAILLTGLYAILFGGAMLIANHKPSFYAFTIPVLPPIVVRLLAEGGTAQLFFAVVSALVMAIMLTFGRKLNHVLTESVARRFENIDLIDELKEQTRIADAARQVAETATRAKSQFFAAASHDLRQPLHAMGLFAAALQDKTREPEVLNLVNSISASVEALENLFAELLDISKIDAGAIQPDVGHFALAPVFARLKHDFEPLAFEKNLRLRVRPSRLWTRSDPVLLERILRNLTSNAIRYTSQGGVLVGARRRGERVRIEVWDTGAGIPDTERDRIFEEFYQAGSPERHSKKGLGLGLSIVQRLANLLGHPIGLRSAVGKGSVFSIEAPLGRAELPKAAESPRIAATVDDFGGRLVAVIEDEDAILEGMKALLSGWGCDVVAGHDADEVLESLGEVGRYPDLLIVDYRLEGGLTGVQVIQRLRSELDADIPALLVTGSASAERALESEQHGYHLLMKPVMPEKLRTMVGFKLKEKSNRTNT
jgi:signal transduction histidine kinase